MRATHCMTPAICTLCTHVETTGILLSVLDGRILQVLRQESSQYHKAINEVETEQAPKQ